MLTTDGRTLELTGKAIAEEMDKTKSAIEYGQPHVIADFATYQRHVGYLSGLAFFEKALVDARSQAEQEAGSPPRQG